MKDGVDEVEGGWCVVLAVQVAKMVVRGAEMRTKVGGVLR